MTLSRQLAALIGVLYAFVFVGNFYITLDNTRRYAATQLESHAQDTATSLGLSLSPHLATGDVLLMESMVDAIFDRGYYREIRVLAMDGTAIVDRVVSVQVAGVPGWFIDWLDLSTPRASAALMSGWQQGGTVDVMSHPGHAYSELWGVAIETLWWSLLALLLALVATALGLRVVLRSLREMEAQALAVAQREFPRVQRIPRARELASVVRAMNHMTAKVEQIVDDLYDQAERQRLAAYSDPVTGLGNQRAFERELQRLVSDTEASTFGAVVLLRFRGLDEVNRSLGLEQGDALLVLAGRTLGPIVDKAGGFAARIGGSLFAVSLPGFSRAQGEQLIEQLRDDLGRLTVGSLEPRGVEIGLAMFGGGQSSESLLERAEAALNTAAEAPDYGDTVAVVVRDITETIGGHEREYADRWGDILRSVIDERALVPWFQPVRRTADASLLHHEVLARIDRGTGALIEAGLFLPMAVRVGLAVELDQLMVETVLTGPHTGLSVAFNLSRQTVEDDGFHRWLRDSAPRPAVRGQVSFEVPEQVLAVEPDAVDALADAARSFGAEIGVDRCGARDIGIEQLRRLKAAYRKIDGSFIHGLDADRDRQRYVETLVALGRGLDLLAIAEMVETQRERETVSNLGFDAVQGFGVGRPDGAPQRA